MRISDWSSDVCSSDLQPALAGEIFVAGDAADGRFVHANGLGDLAQRQRAHLRDAVKEKAFLLLDNFARYLDDRALALVERTHQPLGAGKLFGQPRLALRRRAPGEIGMIAAVDEQAGEGGGVDLARPTLPLTGPHKV